MSSNTNTLFWVITGAVIVLAVFLLINNSQSDTLARISDKFSSIVKDQGIVKFDNETSEENESNNQDEEDEEELPKEVYPQQLTSLGSDFLPIKAGGSLSGTVEGYKVQVYDAYYYTDGSQKLRTRYFISNTNGYSISRILEVQYYDCETDEMFAKSRYLTNNVTPGGYKLVDSNPDTTKIVTKYYIKVVIG